MTDPMILSEIFPLEGVDTPFISPRDQVYPSPRCQVMCAQITALLNLITSASYAVTKDAADTLREQGYDSYEDFVVLTKKMDLPRAARRRVIRIMQEVVYIGEAYVKELDFEATVHDAAIRHYRSPK